ncbi:MAG TPA: HlyD family efflux transporter periplasmic adaptor subunit [Anaerolineales bacterium]|nr:HlyD family efflux transporter periplasmic adaptor subunit [Anaerolineales bacterium]
MKRSYWLRLVCSGLIMLILFAPMSTALASSAGNPVPAPETVTASAVIVPAHVAELGFSISAIARAIPVKAGDPVKAGQTLIVLDTPDLQFAVTAAQAALHSAQVDAELQKYQTVENRRNGKIFIDPIPEIYKERSAVKVQQAQVALEIAQFNLSQGTLTAPFDGTVASIDVVPGEFVPSDQAILTLATLNDLQVETTDLSERDITKVRIGTPVKIIIEKPGYGLYRNSHCHFTKGKYSRRRHRLQGHDRVRRAAQKFIVGYDGGGKHRGMR